MSCASLPGCISLHAYPETWETPLPARADACPDISGSYENTGETTDGVRGATLSGWLQLRTPAPARAFDRVVLDLSRDDLVVSAFDSGGASVTRTLSRTRGDYECADGVLPLHFSESCCFDMMWSRSAGVLKISRTAHHAVLGVSDVGAAVVIFVPLALARHTYFRFNRIEQQPDPR